MDKKILDGHVHHEHVPHEHMPPLSGWGHDLSGNPELAGLELARLIKMVSNLYEAVADEHLHKADVSGPRWQVLWRLRREEMRGNLEGVSPTHLSQCQRVSKNTISALLRGLEEQGLVERTLDPDDRRAFRIRLSDAGRSLLTDTAPLHLDYMNQLVSGLAPEERTELARLLGKLFHSLAAQAHRAHDPLPREEP
jgi:DNA-binding MarR family transcriptional regulator